MKQALSGVWAPLTTPFAGDEIQFEWLAENLRKLNESSLRGYFACGTNGEFRSLTVPERLRVFETVAKHAGQEKLVMGGTAAESTKETVQITRSAADAGVKLASILVPGFFKKLIDDRVMIDYVTEVADRCVKLFGMEAVACDPYLDDRKKIEYSRWIELLSLEELCGRGGE
jgi:4-hydroxy-2-oxoglutarate aldolase